MAALPDDMPAFFRNGRDQLVYLGTEPDRWRTPETPSATEATGANHNFSCELLLQPMPRTRHGFLIALTQAGNLKGPDASLKLIGLAPYAIQEWAEILTSAFRRWRGMSEKTPVEQREKRQVEQNILFMAGVLAHWVTDVSQPMHCSIHILGWSASVPNPHGYTTSSSIHRRYETDYVEHAIDERDVRAAGLQPFRQLGDWLEESLKYIATGNSGVESLYRWDARAPFGSGSEPAAAKPFTIARLTAGSVMLRDVWVTAWIRSGSPALDQGRIRSGSRDEPK